MAKERVELIRETFERWNAGGREITEAAHPDIVVHSAMTSADYHGHEGVRAWMAEIDDQFGDWNLSIDQVREVSEDRILVLGTVHLQGRTSGVAFDQPVGWLLTFAEEQVIEMRLIADRNKALEAAGLSE